MNRMTQSEARGVLTGLLNAYDQYEHGDYFYDHGDEVCEAVILAFHAVLIPDNTSTAAAVERLSWLRMVGRHVDSVTIGSEDMAYLDIAITAIQTCEQMIRTIATVKSQLSDAENCIWAIEDALDRGTDNDWAREAIRVYERSLEEESEEK